MNITPLNTDVDGCASCIKANYYKMAGANFIGHTKDGFRATCIMEVLEPVACAMRGRNPDNPSERGRSNGKYQQRIEMGSNISNTITSVQKDALVAEPVCLNSKVDGKQPSLQDRIYDTSGISTCITTGFHPNIAEPQVLTPKRTDFGKQVRKQYESGDLDMSRHDMTKLEPREDGICNTLTSVQKDNLVAEPLRIPQATEQGYVEVPVGGVYDGSYINSKTRRGRVQEGGTIAPTLMAGGEGLNRYEGIEQETANYRIRKLTPRECYRLMGLCEEDIDKIYSSGISQSQMYKTAGNSIVVDVLYHIFRKMFVETECEHQQLTLF